MSVSISIMWHAGLFFRSYSGNLPAMFFTCVNFIAFQVTFFGLEKPRLSRFLTDLPFSFELNFECIQQIYAHVFKFRLTLLTISIELNLEFIRQIYANTLIQKANLRDCVIPIKP